VSPISFSDSDTWCIALCGRGTRHCSVATGIQEFVKQRLSAHEYPREATFIDEMPMTTQGDPEAVAEQG
jgi:acyl-coenzyme A synthetase/AMP-(fatty) acid ligase